MLQTLKNWFQHRRKTAHAHSDTPAPTPKIIAEQVHLHWHVSDATPMPKHITWNAQPIVSFKPTAQAIEIKPEIHADFDDALLDRARTQWQFGDWESLAALTQEAIEGHPEQAKLALLIAAGCLQIGGAVKAREFVGLAKAWGCDRKLMAQLLVSGVYNSLGKLAAIKNDHTQSLNFFNAAVGQTQTPNAPLYAGARNVRELARFGLLKESATLISQQLKAVAKQPLSRPYPQQLAVLQTEIDLLHHELSIAQQRRQLSRKPTSTLSEVNQHSEDWLAKLKQRAVSQLGQELWVLEMLNYKRNGFFVEFGATDGILLSNTYLLEKEFGWQGICAEPNPKLFKQLQHNRHCLCRDTCIAGVDGETCEFILADAFGSLAAYETCDQHAQKRQAYREANQIITVKTQTLDSFLRACNAPQKIDYLSIDTEGSELEILQAFDLNIWQVKLLTVEHNYQEGPREKIRALLAKYGYQVKEAQWDDWFWREDLLCSANKH